MESSIISERDAAIRMVRPSLEVDVQEAGAMERFQSLTLRPIIKFQNGILVAQFRHYLKMFKPQFNVYNQKVQRSFIHDVLKSDPRIKNSLIASVVSLFTLEEYEFYCEQKSQVNKRIISMLITRFQDELELLY